MLVASEKLSLENPAAVAVLHKAAKEARDLSEAVTDLRVKFPDSNFLSYDDESIDVTMSSAGNPAKGLRLAFVDETGRENDRIVLIDDDAWPPSSYVARLEPRGEKYFPEVIDDGVSLKAPSSHAPALDVERQLDERLAAQFSGRRKRAYWLETSLVEVSTNTSRRR